MSAEFSLCDLSAIVAVAACGKCYGSHLLPKAPKSYPLCLQPPFKDSGMCLSNTGLAERGCTTISYKFLSILVISLICAS